MKIKRIVVTLAVSLCVCAMLVFTFGFLPAIISSAPETGEIITVTTDTVPLEADNDITGDLSESEQSDEANIEQPPETPNINAISEVAAIEAAATQLGYTSHIHPETGEVRYEHASVSDNGSHYYIAIKALDIQYSESGSTWGPGDDPSWFILFEVYHEREKFELIPASYTPEEYLRQHMISEINCYLGADNRGNTVLILPDYQTYYAVVEINALTGEFIASYDLLEEGIDEFYPFNPDRYGVIINEPEPTPQPG